MSHISDPSIFSSTCIDACLYRGFVLVRGGFCSGFVWGFFVWKVSSGVVFVHPLMSEYIHYNRKLNITFNFSFKSVTSHALGPLPCHKLSHLLGPLPPSSVTSFMDGPCRQ